MVFFIRYDPRKPFTTIDRRKLEYSMAIRILTIRCWITWYVQKLLKRSKIPKVVLLYMFYDHDNKHLELAKTKYRDNKNIMVGVASTFPQEHKHTPHYDWRYCLTPNEALVFQVFGTKRDTLTFHFKQSTKDIFPALRNIE
jgi:hypothetical protein